MAEPMEIGGKKPNLGGRPKGVPNKIHGEVRDMILAALYSAGGQDYLAEQAKVNPTAFLSLLSKMVPREASVTVDGEMKVIMVDV